MMSGDPLEQWHTIADELRETCSAEAHTVETALRANAAFNDDGWPAAHLHRSIRNRAIERSAGLQGLDHRRVAGGGLAIRAESTEAGVMFEMHIRVRSATKSADGKYLIPVSSTSLIEVEEPDALIPVRSYVFGVTRRDTDGQPDDIFIARVTGVVDGVVGYLALGTPILLGHTGPTTPNVPSFKPSEQDELHGFDDPEQEGGEDDGQLGS